MLAVANSSSIAYDQYMLAGSQFGCSSKTVLGVIANQPAVLAGVLDVTANVLFLLASRLGLLTLVGVIGAMYPASTLVLARTVLKERMAPHQLVGLGLAVVAVVGIALG